MTISKYQLGCPVEGWNDCPIVIRDNSRRTGGHTKAKSKKHSVRYIYPSQLEEHSNSFDMKKNKHELDLTKSIQSNESLNIPSEEKFETQEKIEQTDLDITSNETDLSLMLYVLNYPSTLTSKEHEFYARKIEEIFVKGDLESHAFIRRICFSCKNGVESHQNARSLKESLKREILDYMLAAHGVGSWCAALKKIVEGLIIET